MRALAAKSAGGGKTRFSTSTDSMGDAVAVLMLACLLGWPNKNCGVTVGGRSYMPLTETPLGASTWGFPAVPGCHWQWPVSPLKSRARFPRPLSPPIHARSEEHTSELQSHSDLVCRLLLEK